MLLLTQSQETLAMLMLLAVATSQPKRDQDTKHVKSKRSQITQIKI